MIASTEYVKGNPSKTTMRTYVTRSAAEARRVAQKHQNKKRSVVFSTYHVRDPKTGERTRLIQVTVRCKRSWERAAEEMTGYGL